MAMCSLFAHRDSGEHVCCTKPRSAKMCVVVHVANLGGALEASSSHKSWGCWLWRATGEQRDHCLRPNHASCLFLLHKGIKAKLEKPFLLHGSLLTDSFYDFLKSYVKCLDIFATVCHLHTSSACISCSRVFLSRPVSSSHLSPISC